MGPISRRLAIAAFMVLAASGAALAQTTLELWTFIDPSGDSPRSKAVANVIRTFEEKNPGVKIRPTVFAWNQINLAFLKAAQSGRTPDLTMLNSGRIQRQIAAKALRPLNDDLAKTGEKDDFLLTPNSVADGKIYGVPYEVRVLGFLYRQDLLDKAGLKVPQSLPELTAAAKKMQEIAGPNFIGVGIGFDPAADSAEKFYIPAVAALGGKLLKEDGSANFVIPEALKVMEYVRSLVQTDKVMPLDIGLMNPDQVRQLVEANRVGFYFQGSHWLLTLRTKLPAESKLNFMPVPAFAGGGWQPAFIEGWNLGIPVAAKQPDLAWKLIEHWTSPDIQLMQSKLAGYLPMRKSLGDKVDPNAPDTAHIKPMLEVVASNALTFPWPQNTDALQESLATAIVNVIAGKQTAEVALREAEKTYNSIRD